MKPIIFIPGIKATALVDTNTFEFQEVWDAYDSWSSTAGTQVVGEYIDEKLQLDPRFDQDPLAVVRHSHIANVPYRAAIQRLNQKLLSRYGDDSPIYLFGYDWRKSNMRNGRRLKRFVDYLKEKLGSEEGRVEGFRFLTHSMGGLVFSCYLKELAGDYSEVDKVALLAPPFRGSPDALVEMVEGEGFFGSLMNVVLRRDADLRKVIRTYPGVFELLPHYPKAVYRQESGEEISLLDLEHWQSNIYDDDVALFEERLRELRRFREEGLVDLADLPGRNRRRMVIVVGEGESTLQSVPVERQRRGVENFVLLENMEEDDGGDGTVSLRSSTVFSDDVLTLAVRKPRRRRMEVSSLSFHGLFFQDTYVQNIVQRFFATDLVTPKIPDREEWWQSIGGRARRV